ncbi:MAG: protein phosphatase 2C domain-containing protein [Mycobacterium sp.]
MAFMPYAGLSDLGRKRSRNDDRWGADPALGLYVVADGVGSTSHGDLAAGLVVEMLPSYVAHHLTGADLRDGQAAERLDRAVVQMCNDLYARSRTDPQLESADTTLVAAVISGSSALIAHLGDSRAYLYRDRQVRRLTSDHTIVQAVVDAGELSPEAAAHHPNRSVVTRHVLMMPPAKPDVRALDLYSGDRILLCSDGLHGVVDDTTLAGILTDYPDPAAACRALTDAANRAGGPDNITAVVVNADQLPPTPLPSHGPTVPDIAIAPPPVVWQQPLDPGLAITQERPPDWRAAPPAPPGPPGPPPQRPRRRRGPMLLLLATVVVLLAAAAITGYLLWPRQPAAQIPAAQTTTPSAQAGNPTTAPGQTALPGFNHPRGVAVDNDGNIYVVVGEGDNAGVLKLAAGSVEPSTLPFAALNNPYGVAVDRAGNVYVTDNYEGGRVLELPIGFSTPIELPFDRTSGFGLSHLSGLAVDTAGHVYVADTSNDRVMELAVNSGGQVALPFADLDHPSDVAVDSMGAVYVADTGSNRVLMLAPASSTQVVLPFAGLDRPSGVAADAAGNVYVTDVRNRRVVKLSAGNQTVLPFTDLGNPTGVAVDAGKVYVTDYENNRLVELPAG